MLIRNKIARSNIGRTRIIPVGLAGTDFELFNQSYFNRVMSVQPSYMIGAWPLWEGNGTTAYNQTGKTYYTNTLRNGTFEDALGYLNLWSSRLSDGAIVDEGAIVHGGLHAVKITAGPGMDTWINQNSIPVTPLKSITFSFWVRDDGVHPGRYAIYNENAAAYIVPLTSIGVVGAAYVQKTYTVSIPAGCNGLRLYLACPTFNTGIVYFDDVTAYLDMSLICWYSPTNVTYGQPGIGDGRNSCYFADVGAGSLGMGHPAYNNVANLNVGSAIAWGKVLNASVWTDATTMRYLWHPKSRLDITRYIVIGGKHTDNYTCFWRRRYAAGFFEKKYVFPAPGHLGWFCMGYSWDMLSTPQRAAGYLYVPGGVGFIKVFDEVPLVGNEVWDNVTQPVDDFNTVLMAGNLASQLWKGWGAHVYQWAGITLSEIEMRKVMVL